MKKVKPLGVFIICTKLISLLTFDKKNMHTTLKFLKSKNNLTLQKEIEIDIINNKNSKFYKITNSMMQIY